MEHQGINVFISYAHESDEFRKSVYLLKLWLEKNSNKKVKVITDHLFPYRPPHEGWPIWMQKQIQNSDIVLLICSPKYKDRFEKNETNPNAGRGVAWEGAIITQLMYNLQMDNNKFFPIIPDKGSIDYVPIILQAFYNGLTFPKNNLEILKCVLNDNVYIEGDLHISQEIIEELENDIVEEIINLTEVENPMLTDIHIMVRSFLSLSDFQKLKVAHKLNVHENDDYQLSSDEMDKEFFKRIKEKNLLEEMWNILNEIKPFTNNLNPFKK